MAKKKSSPKRASSAAKKAHHGDVPTPGTRPVRDRGKPRTATTDSDEAEAATGSAPRAADFMARPSPTARGLGPEAGGQSGDTEGLSRQEIAGPESVEELIEEGQAYEAEVISGVENAPDADQGEVRTHQVPEDDVPQEYLDED
jgi:N utilization substance protein A